MTDDLLTIEPSALAFLSRQMKGNVVDFATGVRTFDETYGDVSLSLSVIFLARIERTADARGIDRTGPEWGPNITGILETLDNFGRVI